MEIRTLKQKIETKDAKVIKSLNVARQILRVAREDNLNVRVIDIKPDRDDPDRKRSVFVFDNTQDFQTAFEKVALQRQEQKLYGDVASIRQEIDKRAAEIADAKIKEILEREGVIKNA